MSGDVLEHDYATVATTSYDADGFILAGIDQYGDAGADPAEMHHVFGFLSRPVDPQVDATGTPTLGCTMFTIGEGSRKAVLPLGDPTCIGVMAQIGKGSSMQYSSCGSFVKLTGAGVKKGFIELGTTDSGGFDMGLQADPANGWTIFGQWGSQALGPLGWHVRTKAGAAIMMGGMAGPGMPGTVAFVNVAASCIRLQATTVNLGPTGLRSPVALATPLAVALTAMQTAIQALAAAVTAMGGAAGTVAVGGVNAPVAGVIGPALATAATAVQAAAAALAPLPAGPTFASRGVMAS